MATKYVALLRGVNVGKGNRVAMADLRALIEGLGYTDVRTLLNSGNVVFAAASSPKVEHGARIEKALEAALGLKLRVTTLDAAELDAIIEANPLASIGTEPGKLLVSVLSSMALSDKLTSIAREQWEPEQIAVVGRVAYYWCPNGSVDSPLFKASSKALGDAVTTRNIATMLKLRAMM